MTQRSEKPLLKTLGALRASGYVPRTIREELRAQLIHRMSHQIPILQGVIGYEETVIPQIQRAILAGHSMNLLGLRGQAKTRMARGLVELLDEWVPVVPGSVLNEDPMAPLLASTRAELEALGDDAPIDWMHRSERYVEKLATPDVGVADLIGDVDPIKAANWKLDYSDERVIAYGLVPRSHRCIFVINELPDLQPRIQVALFNILQEGDVQIRGFRMRLALDLQFIFTANPEDYTQRGAIITPLKDRIQSQILTHYPFQLTDAMAITAQEARLTEEQRARVQVLPLVAEVCERIGFEARDSEYIDPKSGVSARLAISAFEHLVASAEWRALRARSAQTYTRISDLFAVVPAITGKVELVYEGEREGPEEVALHLIGQAIRTHLLSIFPDPERVRRRKMEDVYAPVVQFFAGSEPLAFQREDDDAAHETQLRKVPGLEDLVAKYAPGWTGVHRWVAMEFVLHGLAEHNLIGRTWHAGDAVFSDLMDGLLRPDGGEED
jgi:magnesium chelatase subunit I